MELRERLDMNLVEETRNLISKVFAFPSQQDLGSKTQLSTVDLCLSCYVEPHGLEAETGMRRTPHPRKTSIASKHCLAKISQNILLAYFVPTSCDILVWECGEERQSLNYANATRLLSSKPGLFNFPTYGST